MDDQIPESPALERPTSFWRRPSILSLLFVVAVLGLAVLWTLLRGLSPQEPSVEDGLPWQIQTRADGSSQVFGLTPGQTTLAEFQQRFGDDSSWGLMVPNGGEPSLEAFVDGMKAGFVTGKLVAAFDADPAWMAQARTRAKDSDIGEGGRSRRYRLSEPDQEIARRAVLKALAFMPSVRLDAAMVQQRFGEPAERIPAATGETQWLYPQKGLAIALPPAQGEGADAKAVLQYVAPRDFDTRLRAPLTAPH